MNWGIIGYGEIAPIFIEGLRSLIGQNLYAIASVSKHNFLSKKKLYSGTIIYNTYEDLIKDTNIDIIYIATTNNLHKQNVIAALNAGKNVLCEKPLAVCKDDVVEMIRASNDSGKFLMEGMWTRFLPAYRHFKVLLDSGVLGKVNFARIDFGFFSNWGPERRLKNKNLYGGILLDNTDYNLFIAQDIFNDLPCNISAFATFCETGAEDSCAITLKYQSGGMAQLYSSFKQKTNQEALIYGENGYLHLKPFWNGTQVELYLGEKYQKWEFPFRKNGFEYEIEEVAYCINNCLIESPVIPHSLTINIAGIMDEIIKKIK